MWSEGWLGQPAGFLASGLRLKGPYRLVWGSGCGNAGGQSGFERALGWHRAQVHPRRVGQVREHSEARVGESLNCNWY